MLTKKEAERLAKQAFLEDRPLEAGWIKSILQSMPDDRGPVDELLMKYAYFSGANYMISLLLTPPGQTMEEKKRCLDRMLAGAKAEMQKFMQEFAEAALKQSNNLH